MQQPTPTAWLLEQLEQQLGRRLTMPLHVLQVAGWEAKTHPCPVRAKTQAENAMRKEFDAYQYHGIHLLGDDQRNRLHRAFSNEVVEGALQQPIPVKGGTDGPSWLACCRRAFATLRHDPIIAGWEQEPWMEAEAAMAFLQAFGPHAISMPEAFGPGRQSILEPQWDPARIQIEQVTRLLTTILDSMSKEDRAGILWTDERNRFTQACATTLGVGSILHMHNGVGATNIQSFWRAAHSAHDILHGWRKDHPAEYGKLRAAQEKEWAIATRKTHPIGVSSRRISPAEAYVWESATRQSNIQQYMRLLETWEKSSEVIEFNHELVGMGDGHDCRPTGFWEKQHLTNYIEEEADMPTKTGPSLEIYIPFAASHQTPEEAKKTLEEIMKRDQKAMRAATKK